MNRIDQAVEQLYLYIIGHHWHNGRLTGPDPGLRYNFRLFRFIKSYLPIIPWGDLYYFLQCQGYWIMDNSMLYSLTGDESYKEYIKLTAETILQTQSGNGSWDYPLPEWKGRVATVEGNYGARGLIEAYRVLGDSSYLDGALRWYEFLTKKTGFQEYKDSLCINYFAGKSGRLVPNNATVTLTFMAELFSQTEEKSHLAYSDRLIKFIQYSQKESGELPYAFETPRMPGREHFLCYQYNSFQLMDLASYYAVDSDPRVFNIIKRIAGFLSKGVEKDGHSRYNCFKESPVVPYYTAALAAALLVADSIGAGEFKELSDRAYGFLLGQQDRRGGFYYSKKNYGVLKDRRSYPRYLAMILKHLLVRKRLMEKGSVL